MGIRDEFSFSAFNLTRIDGGFKTKTARKRQRRTVSIGAWWRVAERKMGKSRMAAGWADLEQFGVILREPLLASPSQGAVYASGLSGLARGTVSGAREE
jgi:hypothetical protein